MKVLFKFGTRVVQDMPEYPSGRGGNFVFEIETREIIRTHHDAMRLLRRNKAKFLEMLRREKLSCRWQPIGDRYQWIPTCCLERPIVEVYATTSFCPLPIITSYDTEKQRRRYYIENGRNCGLTAKKLEDLKSRCGRPFAEEKNQRFVFRRAVVMSEDGKYPVQYAYFCPGSEKYGSCGWVSGEPRYDKNNYYCYICGTKIGERRRIYGK